MTLPGIEWASGSGLPARIIGVVQFVPLFLLTLVTGWTADRLDRRWIARGSVALELWVRSRVRLARLAPYDHACRPLRRCCFARRGPRVRRSCDLSALAPNLVPREILPRAIALSSIAWQTGAVLGPALGGYLYAYAPLRALSVSGALFVIALICLLAIGRRRASRILAGPIRGRRWSKG